MTGDVPTRVVCVHEGDATWVSSLEDAGFELVYASDAAGALEVASSVDCVVTSDSYALSVLAVLREQHPALSVCLVGDGPDVPGWTPGEHTHLATGDVLACVRDAVAARPANVPETIDDVFSRVEEAFFSLDEEWRFTYINEHAAELLDADEAALLGECVWDVYPEAVGSTFEEQYARAMDEQEPVSFDSYHAPLETWFSVEAYPSATGLSVYFRDVTEEKRREKQLASQRERLAALNDLNGVVREISEAAVRQSSRQDVERLVCERLVESRAYSLAWICEPGVDGEATELREAAGATDQLDDFTRDLVRRAADSGEPVVAQEVADASPGPARESASEVLTSIAAIPIEQDENTYGVLGVATDRTSGFGEEEQSVLGHLGEIIGVTLTSIERGRKLRERERRYRTLVENVPGGMASFDEDLVYQAAAGTIYEKLDIDADDVVGEKISGLDGIEAIDDLDLLDEETECQLSEAYAAALDGEESKLEIGFADRTLELSVVPIRDEEGNITGGMTLSKDVTERVEHARQLERERERLEFLNRILRHELLNGLNVVDARVRLLSDYTEPPATDHLETVQDRVQKMIELVETLRSFMKIFGTGEAEFERRELGSLLAEEVSKAQTYLGEAAFSYREPEEAVFTQASDLLPEVFQNILRNAVQHNDKETPVVEVSLDVSPDKVTVDIADNGPGVPPEAAETVFEKGEKGFASPGTGFGLYIAREIVESHGGDISVTANTPRGAVFSVTLPRSD